VPSFPVSVAVRRPPPPAASPSPATPTPLEILVRAQMRGNDEMSGELRQRKREKPEGGLEWNGVGLGQLLITQRQAKFETC